MVRPEMVLMKHIADQINSEINSGTKRTYKILFVPRKVKLEEMFLSSTVSLSLRFCFVTVFVCSVEFVHDLPHPVLSQQLHVCEMVLENEGVHGNVTLDEYQLDFVPLDGDVLSLEFPLFLNSYFLVSSFVILIDLVDSTAIVSL